MPMLFCQVEVYGTDQTLVHRSPTDCGVSICELSLNSNSEVTSDRAGLLRQKKVKKSHNTKHSGRTTMTNKEKQINTAEKLYIYRSSKQNKHLNDN
jgi:hypothetical protein